MAKETDGLFLLEVLVDKITFLKSPCFSDKDFRTCVTVSCPSVEPLEICDDDPAACVAKSGGPFVKTFNNGKSCLFSLKESDISAAMNKFPISITVYKSLPCGCLPTKIVMGEATIDMTKEFVQARNKYLEDPSCVSYQALKDTFRIMGQDNTETGDISMFLRISCFGKLIVTKFQGSGGQVTLGASGHTGLHDRSCNPTREFQSLDDPCICGIGRGPSGGVAGLPCKAGGRAGGLGVCPPGQDPYNIMPCEEPDDPCYCTGPKRPIKPPMACRNTGPYCLHVPKGRSKQYEEIGTNLAGNELKIKVPASSAIIKKISQTHCAIQRPYEKSKEKEANKSGPCDPPCGKNQISLALPSEDTCCQGAQLADTQFTCTTEGCTQSSKHQQGGMARGDAKHQELPNKEVFVLKVAKTAMQGDRKCKLELELVAPKGPDKKPPVKKVNMRLQSDECECCGRRPKGRKKRTCPLQSLPVHQDLTEEQKLNINGIMEVNDPYYKQKMQTLKIIEMLLEYRSQPIDMRESSTCSLSSLYTLKSKKRSVSFSSTIDYCLNSYRNHSWLPKAENFFGRDTTVYLSLWDKKNTVHNSGTQATASINKCMQVPCYERNIIDMNSCGSTSNASSIRSSQGRCQEVYFFGRKWGMGSSAPEPEKEPEPSNSRGKHKSNKKTRATVNNAVNQATSNRQTVMNTEVQASKSKSSTGASAVTATTASSSQCAGVSATRGDLTATVSHIRIGPKEPPCPIHGRDPCCGVKCTVAVAQQDQAPVKVTTASNPRRGVFELVVRRLTGAPLAKNELMLEWTPPPCRAMPCGAPVTVACYPSGGACKPSKLVMCRPAPPKIKYCRKSRPCIQMPCGPFPCRIRCKKCCRPSCSGNPCRYFKPRCPSPAKPCCPVVCKPCPPAPCGVTPCCAGKPCKSSPCLRPCPIGRRRPRRIRSYPRIKPHRKLVSPCLNRSKECPVARCRSLPGPCSPCPPPKCCSVGPCKPRCCRSVTCC